MRRFRAPTGTNTDAHPLTMQCGRCRGTGKIRLHPSLLEAFKHLRRGPLTARQLRARIGTYAGVSAMNNRLEDLRKLGLAKRKKQRGLGKSWLYIAVTALAILSCASTGQRFTLDCSLPVGADCFALAERDCPAGYDVVSSATSTRTSLTSGGFVSTDRRQIVVECREGR